MIIVFSSAAYSEEDNKHVKLLKVEYYPGNINSRKRSLKEFNPSAKIILVCEDGTDAEVHDIYNLLSGSGFNQIYTDICEGWYNYSESLLEVLRGLPGFVKG